MNFSLIASFAIILLVLTIGEIISMKTKAFVPSVFVSAILFLVGFWTFFPNRGFFAFRFGRETHYKVAGHDAACGFPQHRLERSSAHRSEGPLCNANPENGVT